MIRHDQFYELIGNLLSISKSHGDADDYRFGIGFDWNHRQTQPPNPVDILRSIASSAALRRNALVDCSVNHE